jgi:hypothetical protein
MYLKEINKKGFIIYLNLKTNKLYTYPRLALVASPTWPALYELGNLLRKPSLLRERILEGGFAERNPSR